MAKRNSKSVKKVEAPPQESEEESVSPSEPVGGAIETQKVLNLQPVKVDEKTFDCQFAALRKLRDERRRIIALERSQKKQLKECGPDVQETVMLALSMDGKTDEEIKRELLVKAYVLTKQNFAVQMALFDTRLGDAVGQAEKRGKDDGAAGKTANPGYPAGSDLYEAYMKAYTAANVANLGLSPGEINEALSEPETVVEPLWNDDPPHLTGTA